MDKLIIYTESPAEHLAWDAPKKGLSYDCYK